MYSFIDSAFFISLLSSVFLLSCLSPSVLSAFSVLSFGILSPAPPIFRFRSSGIFRSLRRFRLFGGFFQGVGLQVFLVYVMRPFFAEPCIPAYSPADKARRFVFPPFLPCKKGGRCFPVYYISTAEKSQPFSPSRPRKTPFSRFLESFPSFLIFPGLFPSSPPAGFIRFQAFPRPFFRFFRLPDVSTGRPPLFSRLSHSQSARFSRAANEPDVRETKKERSRKGTIYGRPDVRLSSDFFREMCAQRPFGAPSALYSP